MHVSTIDNPNDAQVVRVPFRASLINPLNATNFVLVLIAALLLGQGNRLALLYGSKWWVSKIPDNPLLAEHIPVEVDHDAVLRDGEPFAMANTDLVQPVPGLPPGGTRQLLVRDVNLSVVMGRSPFGSGHVVVDAPALVDIAARSCPDLTRPGCARCCHWRCTTPGWCYTIRTARKTWPRSC